MIAPTFLPLALLAGFAPGSLDGSQRVVDEDAAVEVVLPGADWALSDQSVVQGTVAVKVYGPPSPPGTRFSALKLPIVLAPDGLRTRAEQLGAMLGSTPEVTPAKIAGLDGERMEYEAGGQRAIEYGVIRGDFFQVVQVNAPLASWEDPETRDALLAVFDSVRFLELGRTDPLRFDETTADEVRELRRANRAPPRPFAIRSHDVFLDIDPAAGSLRCVDVLEVEALADEVTVLEFLLTYVDVDSFALEGGAALEWSVEMDGGERAPFVRVTLPAPLARGESATLRFEGHADDYFFAYAQQMVAEVEMLGQVREGSSFSSHVHYYPVDTVNDAAVRLSMRVPKGHRAVTGGAFLGEEAEGDHVTFRYGTEERRPRLLPFGFAVGRFTTLAGEAEGGLRLELHVPAEFEERARDYLAIAERSGTLFRRIMGPLPWDRVAICVVDPERRETGVSLPGLILVSDGFFGELEEVEPDGSRLSDPALMGYLLVPDELSHQWNFYSAQLPNELAEGVSTYTNLLFFEEEGGAQEYLEGVRYCAETVLGVVPAADDVAIANPGIYASTSYRTLAFCKTAVVLHMLRVRLGDDVFFDGWKRAFTTIRERDGAYDAFREAFEAASGEDLRAFFDGWLFRPGYPCLRFTWEATTVDGEDAIEMRFEQRQNTPPYEIDLEVEVTTADGETRRVPVPLRERDTTFTIRLGTAPIGATPNPDGTALIRLLDE